MVLIIIGAIILVVFMLLVSFYLAGTFNGIAYDKGYKDGRFFWICFWFGIIGYIAVAALPDRKGNFDDTAKDESKPTEQRHYDSTKPFSLEQKRKNKRDFVIIGAVIAVVLVVILIFGSKISINKICTYSDCEEEATMKYFDEDVCEYHYHVYRGY